MSDLQIRGYDPEMFYALVKIYEDGTGKKAFTEEFEKFAEKMLKPMHAVHELYLATKNDEDFKNLAGILRKGADKDD